MPEIENATSFKIGPAFSKVSGKLQDISKLILGGAVFNTQYNDDPYNMDIVNLLKFGFLHGINTIDTSPYYGPSELLLGKSLNYLINEANYIKRDEFYICTKVGRVKLNDFDYSPAWIQASILRSLERLHTDYLDLVHLHDVEFVEEDKVLQALRKLKQLKQKGTIRHFGISGYPVDYLYRIALLCANDPTIGPLDSVLSYCNGCLQNTRLFDYYDKFLSNCGIQVVLNASILSMSMLRLQEVKPFHPAPQLLKAAVRELAMDMKRNYNEDLADFATRFALRNWLFKSGSTILGSSTVEELNSALQQFHLVSSDINHINRRDEILVKKYRNVLGDHYNEVWESGIPQKTSNSVSIDHSY
ncbi:hypothetical protein LJB42_001456 [Komagataella kurtzmanii]|nr:hypothetical protein LJB42_001456 [Komagataella kurtzmanii]